MWIAQSRAGGTLAPARRQVSPQDLHDLRRNGSGHRGATAFDRTKRRRIDFHVTANCRIDIRMPSDTHAAKLRSMASLGSRGEDECCHPGDY
ncbi:MAG: hypothetical protein WCC69_11890 [Pirellulales bacterium]